MRNNSAPADAIAAALAGFSDREARRFRIALVSSLGCDDRTLLDCVALGEALPYSARTELPRVRAAVEWVRMVEHAATLQLAASATERAARADAIDQRLNAPARLGTQYATFRFLVMTVFTVDTDTALRWLYRATDEDLTGLRDRAREPVLRALLRVVEACAELEDHGTLPVYPSRDVARSTAMRAA